MFYWKLGKQQKTKLGTNTLYNADNKEIFAKFPDNSVDAILTDIPYGISFMNKNWDKKQAPMAYQLWNESWAERAFRILKPGAHMLVFMSPITMHRAMCGIQDVGFEIRDTCLYLHGMGFPKGYDLGQSIQKKLTTGSARRPDRKLGLTRNRWNGGKDGLAKTGGAVELTEADAIKWTGWNSQLKPAFEPCILFRKPLSEKNLADNVLKWGTGAINIDACRIPIKSNDDIKKKNPHTKGGFGHAKAAIYGKSNGVEEKYNTNKGRHPAHILHDGSDEVEETFALFGERKSCMKPSKAKSEGKIFGSSRVQGNLPMDSGTASRFFYTAKVSKKERGGSKHPTQKPISLLQYFATMITPPGGVLLDPFMGSNSTGIAANTLGFRYVGIEQDPIEYRGAILKTKYHMVKS